MDTFILTANILTLLAFVLHAFVGDKELKVNEPKDSDDNYLIKRDKWTMARAGWHWVSYDLLMSSVLLAIINFTDYFEHEGFLLQLLSFYFLGYGIVWLFVIIISKRFPNNYIKLGQWILLFVISGLIYLGVN